MSAQTQKPETDSRTKVITLAAEALIHRVVTLKRARKGRMLLGVCRGIASHLRFPVFFLRAAFLGSILLGGLGLAVYVILAVAMPKAPKAARRARRGPGQVVELETGREGGRERIG